MKTTRKVLSIALVLTMIVAMFVVNASGAEATKLTLIDDINSSVQGIPSTATNIKYLSDGEPAKTVGSTAPAYRANTPWYAEDETISDIWIGVYQNPDITSRKQVVLSANKDDTSVADTGSRKLSVEKKQNIMCYSTDIRLGGYGWKYEKGLGVHPAEEGESAVIYATNGATNFYAVVGNNDNYSSDPKNKDSWGTELTYTVYGSNSADGEWTKLAYVEGVTDWLVGEFNVDISAYSHIKLSVTLSKGTYKAGYQAGAWGNACVYSVASGGTTGTTTGGSNNNDTPSKTADSFAMTAVAALVLGAASVTALVVSKKKFF